jgi:hypothetical protein
VGVGINGDDGLVNFCCTPELVDGNKCDTPGRLLLAESMYSGSLRTLDIPSRGTLEAAIFDQPTISVAPIITGAAVYTVLIANCNQELGRTLHVTGSIEWIRHQDHPADTNDASSENHQDFHQQAPSSGGESPVDTHQGHAEENKNAWPFFVIGFLGLAVVAMFSWRQYQSVQHDHYMNRELHQLVVAEDGDEHFYDLESPGAPMPTNTGGRSSSSKRGKATSGIATNRRLSASFRPETTLSTNL